MSLNDNTHNHVSAEVFVQKLETFYRSRNPDAAVLCSGLRRAMSGVQELGCHFENRLNAYDAKQVAQALTQMIREASVAFGADPKLDWKIKGFHALAKRLRESVTPQQMEGL